METQEYKVIYNNGTILHKDKRSVIEHVKILNEKSIPYTIETFVDNHIEVLTLKDLIDS